ncbi:MAG: tetratricopeptide repeat protein [Alphaproteobacteria bacterium]|nr:tetratricopeptide repeat protein [Alphaproteobacteria bacterium]
MTSRAFRYGQIVLMAAVLLSGCTLMKRSEELPPETTALPEEAQPENPETHFDRAVELLKQGSAEDADAELHSYLELVPKSKPAKFLLSQIETPVAKLYPAKNVRIRVPKDGDLSSVAKTYLGNPLAFYGLARYNGIAVPSDVHEGQWLRIPKISGAPANRRSAAAQTAPQQTAAQQTAAQHPVTQKRATPAEKAEPLPDDKLARLAPNQQQKSPPSAENPASRATAERLYRAGLLAFQKQDLDGAIAAWHKALAADPQFTDAQLRLLEAERLKQKLNKLRK